MVKDLRLKWSASINHDDEVVVSGNGASPVYAVIDTIKNAIELGVVDGDFFAECGQAINDIDNTDWEPSEGFTRQCGDFSGGLWTINVQMGDPYDQDAVRAIPPSRMDLHRGARQDQESPPANA